MKFLKQISTDTTHAFTALGFASIIGCQVFAISHNQAFDAQGLGIALGAILGGAAAHSAYKKDDK